MHDYILVLIYFFESHIMTDISITVKNIGQQVDAFKKVDLILIGYIKMIAQVSYQEKFARYVIM